MLHVEFLSVNVTNGVKSNPGAAERRLVFHPLQTRGLNDAFVSDTSHCSDTMEPTLVFLVLQRLANVCVCVCIQVVRQSDSDKVTVIGAGGTLHEALTAADELASEGKPCPLVAL